MIMNHVHSNKIKTVLRAYVTYSIAMPIFVSGVERGMV